MRNLRKQLPPMTSLIAFEAAARHMSFTLAAEELSLTQAAISRQVRLLEENLGIALFIRSHRAVRLTPEGRHFQHTVSEALERLAFGAQELRTRTQDMTVSVAADMAVSSFWLMPRLKQFRSEYPDITVRVMASDDQGLVESEDVDVAIQLGRGEESAQESTFLFQAKVFPVCSPEYLTSCPDLKSEADLLQTTLLRLDDKHWDWLDWPAWFALNQIQLEGTRNDLYINNYPLVIQAALTGQGMALGWQHLIDDMLCSGHLIKPIESCLQTERGFYLVFPNKHDVSPAAEKFSVWLKQQCLPG